MNITRKSLIQLTLVVIIVCLICLGVYMQSKPVLPAVSKEDYEQVIRSKFCGKIISTNFSPVLVYRLINKNYADFAGSGVLFTGSNGRQVVTTEHLFPKEVGTHYYAYGLMKVESGEEIRQTQGLEMVLNSSTEIAGTAADVVILKVGDPKPIKGFSEYSPAKIQSGETEITPFKQGIFITSLVTGEKVRVLGSIADVDTSTVKYLLLEYVSLPGESGTGFLTSEDTVVLLKGEFSLTTPESTALFKKVFGNLKGISLAYGPLKIR